MPEVLGSSICLKPSWYRMSELIAAGSKRHSLRRTPAPCLLKTRRWPRIRWGAACQQASSLESIPPRVFRWFSEWARFRLSKIIWSCSMSFGDNRSACRGEPKDRGKWTSDHAASRRLCERMTGNCLGPFDLKSAKGLILLWNKQ